MLGQRLGEYDAQRSKRIAQWYIMGSVRRERKAVRSEVDVPRRSVRFAFQFILAKNSVVQTQHCLFVRQGCRAISETRLPQFNRYLTWLVLIIFRSCRLQASRAPSSEDSLTTSLIGSVNFSDLCGMLVIVSSKAQRDDGSVRQFETRCFWRTCNLFWKMSQIATTLHHLNWKWF